MCVHLSGSRSVTVSSQGLKYFVLFKLRFLTHHEQLDSGGDIHEPERSLVLALLPAVEDGVDVGRLVHAGDEPGDVAAKEHHHRGDEHDGQVQIPRLLARPHLPHLH